MKGGKSKAESKKADSRLAVKKTAAKGGKDPNKPKRPPSAFFVFMEGFRKQFNEKNPNNKKVSAVAKAGGDKWKSLSGSEKAPYEAEAAKRKAEYTKSMVSYNKKQSDGGGKKSEEEESDKSKSEVHNDDDEESGEEEDEDDE